MYGFPIRALFLLLFLFLFHSAIAVDLLAPSKGCQDLLTYFKTNALKRVGPYGFNPFPPFFARRGGPVPTALSAVPQAAPSQPDSARPAPEAGVDFSETNVQVEGVDEPDIVKTDGKRVFVLRGQQFHVVSVRASGAAGERTGGLTLPTFGAEMLVEGNRVLVISRDFGSLGGTAAPDTSARRGFIFFPRPAITVVYQISVANRKPRLIATLRMEGSYVSSREVGGIARIVMKFDPTNKIQFKISRGGRPTGPVVSRQDTTESNKKIIRKTTIRTWLPRYVLKSKCTSSGCAQEVRGFVTNCNDIFLPTASFSGFGLLTVATLPLGGTIKPRNSASIASDSGDVYSTASSLYVATTEYRYDFVQNSVLLGASFKTSLHKFSLARKGASYVASGTVSGSVLNQFSMHEFKDAFFVATTEGAPWWTGRDTSKSKVTSFKVRGRKLKRVGEVGNLGIGERIFAVRYIKSTAYVVTFRQVDPLYIIDLSDPRKLRVTGELKIPGFSSYLHPIAEGRILGVGQEATLEGRTTGAKVSLFDVSDVTKPREIAGWTLKGSFTTAQFDHRAFLYWAPESVAVLPVSVFAGKVAEQFIGSIVLDVSDTGITERGRVTHGKCCEGKFRFTPSIERNFVLGRVHLWSLSRETLQVNSIRNLKFESKIGLVN